MTLDEALILRVERYVAQGLPVMPEDGRDLLAAYRALLADVERLRAIEARVRRLMDRLTTDRDGGVQNVRTQVLVLLGEQEP